MQQMFPQLEPPKPDKPFMDKAGWQLVIIAVSFFAGILGTIMVSVWQGTTHLIDVNWFVVIVGVILVIIMIGTIVFCVWYAFITRKKLYEQYNKDRAAYKEEWQRFQGTWHTYFEKERFRWDDFAVDFTRKNMEEQNKRHEELKKQYMDAIADAETRMDSSIKNAQTIFTGAVESQRRAVDTYGEQLIHAQKQMEKLEQRLRKELSLPDEEIVTPP